MLLVVGMLLLPHTIHSIISSCVVVFGLQVQWDEPSSIPRPDRVSPWELEPLIAATPPTSHPAQRNKRARPLASSTIVPDISPVFGMKVAGNYCFSCLYDDRISHTLLFLFVTSFQLDILILFWAVYIFLDHAVFDLLTSSMYTSINEFP